MQCANEKWPPLALLLFVLGAPTVFGCTSEPASPGVNADPSAAATPGLVQPAFAPPSAETLARQALYARKVRELQPTVAHLPAEKQEQARADLKRSIMDR
jgi:hypothetical protein